MWSQCGNQFLLDAQGPAVEREASVKPFVPTVTAISTTPDLQWMVQPTIVTSVSPSPGRAAANEAQSSLKTHGGKAKNASRKGKVEQVGETRPPPTHLFPTHACTHTCRCIWQNPRAWSLYQLWRSSSLQWTSAAGTLSMCAWNQASTSYSHHGVSATIGYF